jgi:hypothetical protein
MRQRFIVRLLAVDGALLAWAEVWAEARPQGRPRSTPFHAIAPSLFVIEQDGIATSIAVHWADLDVARLFALPEAVTVQIGQVLRYDWFTMPVWMVEGSKVEVPLPAVTVRAAVAIPVPTGSLVSAT